MTGDLPSGSIWPANDFEQAQIREVFSRFGLAMYQSQVLEHGLVNALMVIQLLPTASDHLDRMAWEEALDEFYDEKFSKTFGNLMRYIEVSGRLPEDLLLQLREAKNDRDHLAHRFFREHVSDFTTTEGRRRMIAKCEQIIACFQSIDQRIEELISPIREEFGISEDIIESELIKFEAEAYKG